MRGRETGGGTGARALSPIPLSSDLGDLPTHGHFPAPSSPLVCRRCGVAAAAAVEVVVAAAAVAEWWWRRGGGVRGGVTREGVEALGGDDALEEAQK